MSARRFAERSARVAVPLLFVAMVASVRAQDPAPPQPQPKPVAAAAPGQGQPDRPELLQSLAEQLQRVRAQIRAVDPLRDAAQLAELKRSEQELTWQFGALASGVDLRSIEAPAEEPFQLDKELERLLKPLLQSLKTATEVPRQIQSLEARIEQLREREAAAARVAEALQRALAQLSAAMPAARVELQAQVDRWQQFLAGLRRERQVAEASLAGKLEGRTSLLDSMRGVFASFFEKSGLSLLLAIVAGALVLFGMRFLQQTVARWRATGERQLPSRLLEVLLHIAVVVAAVATVLIVFYVRNDFELLALAVVFLLGIGIAAIRTLPQFFEQIRLMLNIGAVREGERVLFQGLPFRVDALRFHCRLVNPELQGGDLRVPVRDLVGLRSRRASGDEPWFPTRPGDVVALTDGTIGRVDLQTPDQVVVLAAGAPKTYATAAFLALAPRNLARGFGVDVTIGLDYRHQREATAVIPAQFAQALTQGLQELVPLELVQRVEVEFKDAAASSLDIEASVRFAGELAGRHAALRRAVARILVDVCTQRGWSIPFPQVTVHRAQDPA